MCTFHIPGEPGNEATILCVIPGSPHVYISRSRRAWEQGYNIVCVIEAVHMRDVILEDAIEDIIKLLLRMFSVEAMLILVKHKSILTSACCLFSQVTTAS